MTWPGRQALAVHRFGVWKHAVEPKILRMPFTLIYRILYGFVRNFYGIELPLQTRIGRRVVIAHQHGIIVHPNAVIGDDCVIRQGVTIGQGAATPGLPPPPAPKLGNRVLIGAGAVLMGDITIGDDVTIGPNVVVMTNVPARAIVTAPPARILARPPTRRLAALPEAGEGPAPHAAPEMMRKTAT